MPICCSSDRGNWGMGKESTSMSWEDRGQGRIKFLFTVFWVVLATNGIQKSGLDVMPEAVPYKVPNLAEHNRVRSLKLLML